jgi:hypothetical protein
MLFRLRLACSRSRLYNRSAVGRLPEIGAAASEATAELAEKPYRSRVEGFDATALCNRGTITHHRKFGSK